MKRCRRHPVGLYEQQNVTFKRRFLTQNVTFSQILDEFSQILLTYDCDAGRWSQKSLTANKCNAMCTTWKPVPDALQKIQTNKQIKHLAADDSSEIFVPLDSVKKMKTTHFD